MEKQFEIKIPKGRKHICYNYGCNHWYLCVKSDHDGNMKACCGFKTEKNKSYRKFRIEWLLS